MTTPIGIYFSKNHTKRNPFLPFSTEKNGCIIHKFYSSVKFYVRNLHFFSEKPAKRTVPLKMQGLQKTSCS